MKIGMENAKGRQMIDHRTHFIDRGVRYSHNNVDYPWQETSMISYNVILKHTPSFALSASGHSAPCFYSILTEFAGTSFLLEDTESVKSMKLNSIRISG